METKKIPTYNFNARGLKTKDGASSIAESDGSYVMSGSFEVDGSMHDSNGNEVLYEGDVEESWVKYRHTVYMEAESSTYGTLYLSFTNYLSKNTPIDSIQDLVTLCGDTNLACSGFFQKDDQVATPIDGIVIQIHIGTTISNSWILMSGHTTLPLDQLTSINVQDDVSMD